jgi:hypothetical protein
MNRRGYLVWASVVVLLAVGAAAFFLLADQSPSFRFTMMIAIDAALINLLAVPLFLIGMKRFKVELQQAYIVLSVGIGLFGLAQIQLPVVNLYHWNFWFDSGGIAIPYLVGVICIFWGMRSFAGLLAIKSPLRSFTVACMTTVIVSVAASFLPHVQTSISDTMFHVAVGLSIWNAVFITFSTILAFRIRQKIGVVYANSMNWLFAALVALTFAVWHYAVVQLLFKTGDWYYDYSIFIVPSDICAILFVIAGLAFNSIDAQHESVQDTTSVNPEISELSPSQELEVVLYMANFVSNPADISPIVQSIQDIKSEYILGSHLLPQDQKVVARAYAELETYLLQQDTLRVFTREELRRRIVQRFGLSDSVKTTLWKNA